MNVLDKALISIGNAVPRILGDLDPKAVIDGAESSISDWKKKHTNPVSDKILIICEVLDISPYELLSGAEHIGTRSRDNQTYVFAKDTELGMVVETYQQLDYKQQKRLLGYMDALKMNN